MYWGTFCCDRSVSQVERFKIPKASFSLDELLRLKIARPSSANLIGCLLNKEACASYIEAARKKEGEARLAEEEAASPKAAAAAAEEEDHKPIVKAQALMRGHIERTVRAAQGWLGAIRVSLWEPILYGAFVWARRPLNSAKRRFPAPRAAACVVHYLVTIVTYY